MRTTAWLQLIASAWIAIMGGSAQTVHAQATVLLPAFTGDLDAGRGTSFVLKLAVQTTQKLYDSRPDCTGELKQSEVHKGSTFWIPGPLAETSEREASRIATLNGAQVVVWGSVSAYPGRALISPFVTVVNSETDLRQARPEQPSLATPAGQFLLEPPASTLSFDSLEILDGEMKDFSYSRLKLCDAHGRCRSPGQVYSIIKFLDGSDDLIKVQYQGANYRLSIKALTTDQRTIVRYLGALTALLKQQDNRATCGFRSLANDNEQTTGVRISALYYLSLIDIHRGKCPLDNLLSAFNENDASNQLARALVIAYSSDLCVTERAAATSDTRARRALADAISVIQVDLSENPDPQLKNLLNDPVFRTLMVAPVN